MPPIPKPPGEKVGRVKSPITTHKLPATGRQGPPPRCPYTLGSAGRAWWRKAWKTPQACAWNEGHIYTVARRALLEDVLERISVLNPEKVSALDNRMNTLDGELGLTPKSMASLHWLIVDDAGRPTLTVDASGPTSELDMKRRAKGLLGNAVAGP